MTSKKHLYISIFLILVFLGLTFLLVREQRPGAKHPFRYGLDLVGGTELIFNADTSEVSDVGGAMESLKEVIERRVNIFGVSEPLVQVERASVLSGRETNRLIVELPGYKNVEEAKNALGKTPVLEFFLLKDSASGATATNTEVALEQDLVPTGLTGKYLSNAQLRFDNNLGTPYIGIDFNDEGAKLFATITKEHKGEALAIVLDGTMLSAPTIQDEISDGKAVISGNFTTDTAKQLVRDLNYGSLPVPISLVSSETIGATLGESALDAGVKAGLWGFLALAIFMIVWYRLPGLLSVVALAAYTVLSLVLFALVPVTFSAAGIAGFILSIGMAVDANVLIFERTKEELKRGKSIYEALHEGFARAWLSIRDSNISSTITAIILFWLGTSAVKGFALTLGLGVLVSMFTAITVTRTFLFAIAPRNENKFKRFLFSNGLHIK